MSQTASEVLSAPAAEALRTELRKALRQGALELPTLPDVALRIRMEIRREQADVDSVADIIGLDPAIASSVVRVVNAPLYRALMPIRDLHKAVSRLGLEGAANLAVALALRQVFVAREPAIRDRMAALRDDALQVAAAAHQLALTCRRQLAEEALLAGLVYRIGALPILTWFEAHADSCPPAAELDRLIEEIHPEFGTSVLDAWGFPRSIVKLPRSYRLAAAEQSDLALLIAAARELCAQGNRSGQATVPHAGDTAGDLPPALHALGIDATTCTTLLSEQAAGAGMLAA